MVLDSFGGADSFNGTGGADLSIFFKITSASETKGGRCAPQALEAIGAGVLAASIAESRAHPIEAAVIRGANVGIAVTFRAAPGTERSGGNGVKSSSAIVGAGILRPFRRRIAARFGSGSRPLCEETSPCVDTFVHGV